MTRRKTLMQYPALVRHARWLEQKIADGRPGRSYDNAEYAELLLAFKALGVDFEPRDAEASEEPEAETPRHGIPQRPDLEEPPSRPDASQIGRAHV